MVARCLRINSPVAAKGVEKTTNDHLSLSLMPCLCYKPQVSTPIVSKEARPQQASIMELELTTEDPVVEAPKEHALPCSSDLLEDHCDFIF